MRHTTLKVEKVAHWSFNSTTVLLLYFNVYDQVPRYRYKRYLGVCEVPLDVRGVALVTVLLILGIPGHFSCSAISALYVWELKRCTRRFHLRRTRMWSDWAFFRVWKCLSGSFWVVVHMLDSWATGGADLPPVPTLPSKIWTLIQNSKTGDNHDNEWRDYGARIMLKKTQHSQIFVEIQTPIEMHRQR